MKTFTKQQNRVLTEIYRRLNYFHHGNTKEPLMLLALPSTVKCLDEFKLLRPYSKEIPRARNWYSLTHKGQQFFNNYAKNGISQNENSRLFVGKVIEFDIKLLNHE